MLAFATLLAAFTDLASISIVGLVVSAVVAALVLRAPARRREAPRWRGRFADAGVVVGLALVIPNLVVFTAVGETSSFTSAFTTRIAQFHQDFYLGPANIVIHGGAMLVDTASQYGVGSIYAIAAWFQLAPLATGPWRSSTAAYTSSTSRRGT